MAEHEEYFAQLALQQSVLRRAKRELWSSLLAVILMASGIMVIAYKIMEVWR